MQGLHHQRYYITSTRIRKRTTDGLPLQMIPNPVVDSQSLNLDAGINALWLAHDTNSNQSESLLSARIDFQVAEIAAGLHCLKRISANI